MHSGCRAPFSASQCINCWALTEAVGKRWARMQTHRGVHIMLLNPEKQQRKSLNTRTGGESLGGFREEVILESWHR